LFKVKWEKPRRKENFGTAPVAERGKFGRNKIAGEGKGLSAPNDDSQRGVEIPRKKKEKIPAKGVNGFANYLPPQRKKGPLSRAE